MSNLAKRIIAGIVIGIVLMFARQVFACTGGAFGAASHADEPAAYAACVDDIGSYGAGTCGNYIDGGGSGWRYTRTSDGFTSRCNNYPAPSCPGGQEYNYSTHACESVSCDTVAYPAGSTVAGHVAGLSEFDSDAQLKAAWCDGNCQVKFSYDFAGSQMVDGVKKIYAYGNGRYTGGSCSDGLSTTPPATVPKIPDPSCGENQTIMIQGGTTYCYDESGEVAGSGPAIATDKPSTKSTTNETVTNPDGSTTVTTTVTDLTTGATTTTVNNYAPGVTPPVLPTDSTGPGEEEGQSECEKHPETVGCAQLGDAPGEDELGDEERGVSSITPVGIGGSGSCPADVALPHGAAMSYGPICTFASGLKPIILALAWLSAGLIVLGVKGDD